MTRERSTSCRCLCPKQTSVASESAACHTGRYFLARFAATSSYERLNSQPDQRPGCAIIGARSIVNIHDDAQAALFEVRSSDAGKYGREGCLVPQRSKRAREAIVPDVWF